MKVDCERTSAVTSTARTFMTGILNDRSNSWYKGVHGARGRNVSVERARLPSRGEVVIATRKGRGEEQENPSASYL